MIKINFDKLNPLELKIHEQLTQYSQEAATIKITAAALYCSCSVSKISKFVKKLGFENYKQYIDFLYQRETDQKKTSNEILRIQEFLSTFDVSIVDEFIELIDRYDKIILFGWGPSFICVEYFEYKLRIATNKFIIAVPDELSADKLLDEHTLLIIFSATGTSKSFARLHQQADLRGAELVFVVEEYAPELLKEYNNIFMLTQSSQSKELKPFQKTRTIFFIFIEEILLKLYEKSKELS